MTAAEATRGTLLVADKVITLGHGRYHARAVLVRGSKVVWVGDDPAAAPPHAARQDLDGCVLGPAFVDAHVHLTPTGVGLVGLDLTDATSGAELLDAVRTYAAQHTGQVVWGHGFDPHGWPDDPPGPDELAAAAPGRSVYLSRVDVHSAIVDRHTLTTAPLARASGVDHDAAGEPTGVLRREAHHIVRRWAIGAMSGEELERARVAATSHAARLGIASVHEMGGPDIMGIDDFDAWCGRGWPVEVIPYWGDFDLSVPVERELRQIGGDLFLDGSLGSRTAALCSAYADGHGAGELEHEDDTLIEFLTECTQAGIQVGVHAIGDAALHQIVRCWRAVEASLPDYLSGSVARLRHRIEHAEVLPPALVDDISQLGLTVSAQPAFEAAWGGRDGMYAARLGPERVAWTNPWRQLADRGVPLAFGSDSNVTPMDPWGGVYAAEHHPFPEHAVSRLEAVSASTLGGRTLARQHGFAGVVRAGMRADLAVWEGDPLGADDPRGARCVLTICRGRRTHGEGALPAWSDGEEIPR